MVQVVKVWPLSPSKMVVVFSTLTLADTQKSACQFMVYFVALVEHPFGACGPNQASRSINVYCLFSIHKSVGFPLGTLDPRSHRPSQTGAFNLRLDKRRRHQLQRPMAKWPPHFINWVTGFASVGVLFLSIFAVCVFFSFCYVKGNPSNYGCSML